MKSKPLFLILLFITICSCEFFDEGEDCLGKDEVEAYAEVLETSDSFVVSGYFKSLNSSKKSDINNGYILKINVQDAANWQNVAITITTDEEIKIGLLGDSELFRLLPDEDGFCYLDIPAFELNRSHMRENFSIKFSKNISYKINIKSLIAFLRIGLRSHDGFGCGDYMKTDELIFEINQIIESI